MKRIFTALFAVLLFSVWFVPQVSAAEPAQILTSGEAVGGNYELALDNAYRRAILKAAINFVTTDAKDVQNNAVIQAAIAQREKYIVGKPKIIQKSQKNGKSYIVCRVPVDMDALQKFIKSRLQAESQKADTKFGDNQIYFVVRLSGNIDSVAKQSAGAEAVSHYMNELRKNGFSPSQTGLSETITRMEHAPRDAFFRTMESELPTIPEMPLFAVLCDINVNPRSVDAFGATSEAKVFLRAYDLRGCDLNVQRPLKMIAEFSDNVELRREKLDGMDGANKYVIVKAAYNSAHYIAGKIYEYWQNNR